MKSRQFFIGYLSLMAFIFLESYTFFHLRSLNTNIYLKPSFHFGMALLAAFLFFGIYWRFRKKIDYRLLSIISLKILPEHLLFILAHAFCLFVFAAHFLEFSNALDVAIGVL